MKSVVVIDYGSQHTFQIAKLLRSKDGGGVCCDIICPEDLNAKVLSEASGIILSGGPQSVHGDIRDIERELILNSNIPTLGICYGMQLISTVLGAKVKNTGTAEFGPTNIIFTEHRSKLFSLSSSNSTVWMSHNDSVYGMDFNITAITENGHIAAFERADIGCYAVQFHPEVKHTEIGASILYNFVTDICNITPNMWTETEQLSECFSIISKTLKSNDRVLLGLSGGIDSAAVAGLLSKHFGSDSNKWIAVFVDHGLLRTNEAQAVCEFAASQHIPLKYIDKSEAFFTALQGISDPEKKRKIIGKLFVDAFLEAAEEFNPTVLAQGTIYPDVVESAKSSHQQHVIKSHHNVGGLPETLNLRLLEPLRHLFKHEVRIIGEKLSLPLAIVTRQPFPGPGIAIRVLGEVTRAKVSIVQRADFIFQEEIAKLPTKPSQYYAALLEGLGVGVVGDQRRRGHIIALRAVQTDDFMTAKIFRGFTLDWLEKVSARIVNECKEVALVMFNTTPKPPGTIELE